VPNADQDRRQALVDLLSLPDSPDLPMRTNKITAQGRSDRFKLLPYLASSFVQSKLIELAERESWRTDSVQTLDFPRVTHEEGYEIFVSQIVDRWTVAAEGARQLGQRMSSRALAYLGLSSPKEIVGGRGSEMPRLIR
jgi:hypothetical protein